MEQAFQACVKIHLRMVGFSPRGELSDSATQQGSVTAPFCLRTGPLNANLDCRVLQ